MQCKTLEKYGNPLQTQICQEDVLTLEEVHEMGSKHGSFILEEDGGFRRLSTASTGLDGGMDLEHICERLDSIEEERRAGATDDAATES